MFISESPQARPLRPSATRPHITVSYSLSTPFSLFKSHISRSFPSFLLTVSPPPSLSLSRDGLLQRQIRRKKVCYNVTCPYISLLHHHTLLLPVPFSHSLPSKVPHSYTSSCDPYRDPSPTLAFGCTNCL